MSNIRFVLSMLAASLIGGLIVAYFGPGFSKTPFGGIGSTGDSTGIQSGPLPSGEAYDYKLPAGISFVEAAKSVTPAVVHIRTSYKEPVKKGGTAFDDMFREFFGKPRQPREHGGGDEPTQMATGSGVIISKDGYITTNNHVIDRADKIEVVLGNNQKYQAKLIGADPSTDLALLKIEAPTELPFVPYGNSDAIQIGEWVLAVGNPFDLTSTVTAGIVSAKARNINLLREAAGNMSIESFIQTDAAVNPGNSGGALVNLKGELVGINTGIASNTGSYSGYSFAVPVSLVRKVMDDLLQFGLVQRALLGVSIIDVTAELADQFKLDKVQGVYVAGVAPGSAAEDAGIEKGDVITAIAGKEVNTVAELQELIARNRPGDKVIVTVSRAGSEQKVSVTLKNKNNSTAAVKEDGGKTENLASLGGTFQEMSEGEKTGLRIKSGLKIIGLSEGNLYDSGVEEGFILLSVDKTPINTIEELKKAIKGKKKGEGALLEGIYPDGQRAFYGMGF